MGIARDPLAPPRVRLLGREARFGARGPKQPAEAAAFQAIGPAATKLGQALATRPDLVGEAAARDLLRLQDALPPAPFTAVHAQIEAERETPAEAVFASIDPEPVGAASVAQVTLAVPHDAMPAAVKVTGTPSGGRTAG